MDLCESLLFLRLIRIMNMGISVVRIIVPIGLIVKLFLDGYHDMISNDGKRLKELGVKRIVAALVVFIAPVFINLVLKLFEVGSGDKFNYPYCLSSFENVEYYERLAVIKRDLLNEEKRRKQEELYAKRKEEYQKELEEMAKKVQINDDAAMYMGQKYSLTNDELRGLCGVAKAEQGSIEGAKAEASLMANLYELKTSGKKTGGGLYHYVRTSGWFANAEEHMDLGCPSNYLNAVRDVLVNGNRTLPFYINEHDCFGCIPSHACLDVSSGDICKINTNGVDYTRLSDIKNRSNYIKDNTKVYSYYYEGGYWIFYSFPAKNSDPFGYTELAKKRVQSMGG